MKIIIINKEIFQNRPPVISTILTLSDLGHELELITVEINDYWNRILEDRGIKVHVIPERKSRENVLLKVLEYINFKRQSFRFINQSCKLNKDTYLWVIGGNAIFCLGTSLLKYKFILQIQELHEEDFTYLKVFKKLLNRAQLVFLNEYNRSVLYQCWFKLKKRPIVLPNKPYFIDVNIDYNLSDYISESDFLKIKSSKVILFQGLIEEKRDLSPYILAAKEIGGYQMVLLGPDYGMVQKYKQLDESLIHIKRIPAPYYLGITKMAHICLITYADNALNYAYCAPNKIYEYGAFGKPIVGNDIPGLHVLEKFHAGVLVDESDVASIKKAYSLIEKDYSNFSLGALSLFEKTDNKFTIENSIRQLNI